MQRRAEINVREVCYQQTQFSHMERQREPFSEPPKSMLPERKAEA
jgi:hypothetical protein